MSYPPYYIPPPPPPPPSGPPSVWSRFTAWWRALGGGLRVPLVIGAVAVLILVVCCPLSLAVDRLNALAAITPTVAPTFPPTATSASSTSPAPTAPTAPTATLVATSPPTSAGAPAGAQLGGPASAYGARFGPETETDDWQAARLAGVTVQLDISTSPSVDGSVQSQDGQARVYALIVTWPVGSVPALATRQQAMRAFFPADARSISAGGASLYGSPSLAAAFTPDSFQDNAGDAVPPGRFQETCDSRSCALVIGQD